MKEWQSLLTYADYYQYSFKDEAIHIKKGRQSGEALACYTRIVSTDLSDADPLIRWAFDVALDCVITMPENARADLLAAPDPIDLHFGYGMYIRNHYLYPAKKRRLFDADDLSGVVMRMMLAMLHPTRPWYEE